MAALDRAAARRHAVPMCIEVIVEDPAWDEAALATLAERAAAATLSHLGLDPALYLAALLATGDERIAALNAEFRGKPAPTNVLSWPSAERTAPMPGWTPAPPPASRRGEPEELGDIALAHGICRREAAAQAKPFEHHVSHLIVHGVLHLLGYDHQTEGDAAQMEALEAAILAELGQSDPYS